jgi:repressor LexA
MTPNLTEKQRAVLDLIREYWEEFGAAPSLADLAGTMQVSRSTMHEHMMALGRKGYLDFREGVGRSWRLTTAVMDRRSRRIPVVGVVAAGQPIFAREDIEGWVTVDDASERDELFALRIRGDSMRDGGILHGDLVVVRRQETAEDGDIVVALVDDEEATVKKLERGRRTVRLLPMNPDFHSIEVEGERVRIQGKVVGVRRSFD